MSINYKQSGVNIDAGNQAVERITEAAASTFSTHVLTGLGSFGAFFDLAGVMQEYRHPVLVQSIDGVGTKVIAARMANDFSRIGKDLLSACCNDIAVHGAKPLTFLDYIANDTLDPERVGAIIDGLAEGCREHGISLIGGETAEMPDTYLPGEHDLVGIVTGAAEKGRIINGDTIVPGDLIIGVSSSGLHTNGYSLA
ncbi:MAG: phosphoribosylformylglycinamidine cyclo-ligase, partial [Spirochaetales bacterium]|nr:phosphoribosylformylglycinamidine cyclo-ligase [Spirochaetales bacterium]